MTAKLNILFICRANCFRSKVAEAYFKKINKNKNIKAKSAGVIGGYKQSESQINFIKGFGINLNGFSKGITADLLRWTDILIIVADDVPSRIFDYEIKRKYIKKIIRWNITDVESSRDEEDNKRAIKQVMKKVDKLNKDLESGKLK